jgi:hypothetical protein
LEDSKHYSLRINYRDIGEEVLKVPIPTKENDPTDPDSPLMNY